MGTFVHYLYAFELGPNARLCVCVCLSGKHEQINKIRKCDLARQLMSAFFVCEHKTCIDYEGEWAKDEYAYIWLWSNRSEFQSRAHIQRQQSFRCAFFPFHPSRSRRVSAAIIDFLNTLILLCVRLFFCCVWTRFIFSLFHRARNGHKTRKYSDLAALLSNGLAHTIYFARLFLIFLQHNARIALHLERVLFLARASAYSAAAAAALNSLQPNLR